MLGIFDSMIRTATGRDVWDAPASWMRDRRTRRDFPDRKTIERERASLRHEMLIRSGR